MRSYVIPSVIVSIIWLLLMLYLMSIPDGISHTIEQYWPNLYVTVVPVIGGLLCLLANRPDGPKRWTLRVIESLLLLSQLGFYAWLSQHEGEQQLSMGLFLMAVPILAQVLFTLISWLRLPSKT
ncbi:hypothetical protein [Idiomarina xiamenensis]|uniref:Transmembrane protein n=1 Tax=Idiomarina xiamenensis 10-D-4 TaxID=740709 RepID=K2KC28_9GAMM|nr:hypothetical protein [Idiomarina xiamenensis]EKE85418.1 hypothetical protein A10D4_03700 [Idiomarina xiamenensis 10-D-4]